MSAAVAGGAAWPLADAPASVFGAFAAGLCPPRRCTVSQWADRYRVLSKVSSAEHGRWSTRRTPYLREIMDLLSGDDPTQEIVFMKCTQIGGTEAGNNWIGQHVHQGVGTMMVVLPTSAGAKKASKTRVSPMLADTPVLRGRVREAKSRDSGNTTLMKEFGDGAGVLIFAGANSANDLKSSPAGLLFLDEIEEYPADVEGQGDPEALAVKRTDTFARRKIFKVSTPTIAGGRIDRAYRASDQRRYLVPCPFCGHEQELRFDRLRWATRRVWERVDTETGEISRGGEGDAGAVERDTGELLDVFYACERCDARIDEHHKARMLEGGRWVAYNPGPDRAAGFKINALYSPIGWFGWRKVVLSWLEAERDTSGQLRRTFQNTVLGEAYEEAGETVDEHFLKQRVEAWRIGERVPAGALILCAGVDVQHDRLEARVWGYGREAETWLVDRHVLYGSPAQEDTWTALERLLEKAWPHELGGTLQLAQVAIDASDGNTTHFVREFVRRWAPSRRVIAVKGASHPGKALLGRPTDQDVNWRGKLIRGGVKLWPMGSDTGKAAFYARLRIERPGPGYVHLPMGLPEDEFAQLTAERKVTRYIRGHAKVEWHLPSGRRNEALDCRVMADAAAERFGVRTAQWDRIADALRAAGQGDLFAREKANEPAQDEAAEVPAQGDDGDTPGASVRIAPGGVVSDGRPMVIRGPRQRPGGGLF